MPFSFEVDDGSRAFFHVRARFMPVRETLTLDAIHTTPFSISSTGILAWPATTLRL
jgi:hypothetical protein